MKMHSKVIFIIAVVSTSLRFCSPSSTPNQPRRANTFPDANGYSHLTKITEMLRRSHVAYSKRAASSPNATNWSVRSQLFYRIVSDLGLFKLQGVDLEMASQKMVDKLKMAKDNVLVVPTSNQTKRQLFHDFCVEKKVSNYVLAYEGERLVYKIETVECIGKCYSKALQTTLGKCVLRKKDIVVYVQSKTNNFVPKVVKVGCACECLHFSSLQ